MVNNIKKEIVGSTVSRGNSKGIYLGTRVPRRIPRTWGELKGECLFYEISMGDMARFLGIQPGWTRHRMSKFPDKEIPRNVTILMALLSMFPPAWVRNRLQGLVHFDYYDDRNRSRQHGLDSGLEEINVFGPPKANLRRYKKGDVPCETPPKDEENAG